MPSSPNPSVSTSGSKPSPSSRTVRCDRRGLLADLDDRALGLPVLGGVGQRLLDDPVERRLELGRVASGLAALLDRRARRSYRPPDRGGRSARQPLERGLDAELVQRRWAQVGDQRTQVGDRFLQLIDRLADGLAERFGPIRAPGRRQADPQRAQALQRLVVQLTRPAPALALRSRQALAAALGGRPTGPSPRRWRRSPRTLPAAARPPSRTPVRRASRSSASSTPWIWPRKTSGTASPPSP